MPTSRGARRAALLLLLAGASLPALGQDRPESILPPGFGDPAPASSPAPAPNDPPNRPTSAAPVTPGAGTAVVQPLPATTPSPVPSPTPSATPTPIDPEILAEYELPAFARRSLASVGAAGRAEGALGPAAWGRVDGGALETLMRRLDAPLPSRWASILLRRALVAEADTPPNVNGADFAAERAWLLLRMGEAAAARAVVQSVDRDDYTPKLYQVALNAMLATSDPAGLCPLAEGGAATTGERGWTLARAMCTALSGQGRQAGTMIAAARRRRTAGGIDLLLAQKVVGVGGGRQAVTIEWTGVDRLSAWRWGLATATGVAVPSELMAGAGPWVRHWQATSPAVALEARAEAAEAAAAQGVLSGAALVDLYGQLATYDEAPATATSVAQTLRTAMTDRDRNTRLAAIRALWGEGERVPYARLVLTARAAARVRPAPDGGQEDLLVASMLSTGMDRTAARWRDAVAEGGDAWAMLMLADPDGGTVSYSDFGSYAGKGRASLKQRFLFAGLAGLGRLSDGDIERAAEALDIRIGAQNGWTRAIDRAAAAGQQGTVALLAAVAMQTGDWSGVPPAMLYRLVGALRAVGLGGEARMIAAEAIARA